MSTAPVVPVAAAPPAKVSFLKRIGQIAGKILNFLSNNAKPIADQASAVAEALLPQFAPEIAVADNLVTKISKQAIVTESLAATAGAATTGEAKFSAVMSEVGPEIDQWVQNAFPGTTEVTAANKAGLVQAVFNIVNDVQAPAVLGSAPATAAPASATPAATS